MFGALSLYSSWQQEGCGLFKWESCKTYNFVPSNADSPHGSWFSLLPERAVTMVGFPSYGCVHRYLAGNDYSQSHCVHANVYATTWDI